MAAAIFADGVQNGIPQFGSFGSFAQANRQTVYVTPDYLLKAARRKYGKGIRVIGAVDSALAEFWDTVQTKGTSSHNKPAEEVSRIISDITAKEHCNWGNSKDEIEVETNEEESRKETKSYSLSFGKQTDWEFGGGVNVGGSFFNTASASLGIQGKFAKGKSRSEEHGKEEERELSQSYGVTGKITVPAKTKVHVRITTYAVTYRIKVKVVLSAPATSRIPFYYKKGIGKLCCPGVGPTFRKFGYITAAELFQFQDGFQNRGYCVEFTKDSELSYIGQTAEMAKTEETLASNA